MVRRRVRHATDTAKYPSPRQVSAGQGYRTSSPVMARPMIRRWISEVPSKMVKLSGVPGAEQRICCDHAAELAISL